MSVSIFGRDKKWEIPREDLSYSVYGCMVSKVFSVDVNEYYV
jgi:hypothetical protein